MSRNTEAGLAFITNPFVTGIVGAAVGFFFCWTTMVRPLVVHLDQREQALHEWERINRQEREAIADIKTIGTEELRKWVSTLDEQNTRYAQLQTLLHKQELALVGPATTHLWISLLAVLAVLGFVFWMMRDSNADAARTLHNAVAVLPSLREALREDPPLLDAPRTESRRIESANPSSAPALPRQRKSGTVKRFVADRAFGFIEPDDGGDEVFFHKTSLRPSDAESITDGKSVTFCIGQDRSGRPCAEDVQIEE